MILADIDRTRQLVTITIAGVVEPEEVRSFAGRLRTLLADVAPGLRLLTDLSGVKSMSTGSAPYIGQIMDLCAEKGVEMVVRVLPAEPTNDIGFAIMSQFHYGPEVRIVTCATREEAAARLSG
jgi:hypothetical protein